MGFRDLEPVWAQYGSGIALGLGFDGLTLRTMRSFRVLGALSFQAPAPRPAWDWEGFKAPKEAPQYGVLEISNGNTTLQYTQFCDFALGMDGYS